MSQWRECKLGDVAEYTTGKLNSNAAKTEGLYPFFTCSPETLRINDYAFDEEALVLAGNNAEGVFSLKYFYGKFNAYQRTYIITVKDRSETDYKFLFYSLKTQLSNLEIISHGTATKYLTLPILNDIPLLLPPLPEQRAIAGVLSSLDDKIDLLHRQNKTLESLAETLWRKMFVEEADPGWKKGKLGDICTKITKGTTPTTLKRNFTEEGINFIKVESIDDHGNFNREKFAHIDEETNKLLSRSIIQAHDILYTIAGTIGRTAVVTQEILPANTNQAVAIIRLHEPELFLSYIRLLMKNTSITNDLESKVVHAVQPNLSLGMISDTDMSIPDRQCLTAFNERCNPLFLKLRQNTEQINSLNRLRDSLLPKLMSGEVRVNL